MAKQQPFRSFSSGLSGYAFAATTALLWGLLAIALKWSLSYGTLLTIVFVRFFVAFVGLGALAVVRNPGVFRVFVRPPWRLLLATACLALNYFSFFHGIELTASANAQVLMQTGPLMLIIFGIVCFKERLNILQIIGLVICTTGFLCFFRDQIGVLTSNQATYFAGNAWVLLGALSWAVFAALQKSLLATYRPQTLNLFFYGACSLVFAPFVTWTTFGALDLTGFSLFLFCGINTLFAYGALGEALLRIPAYKVSMIISINPLVTILSLFVLEQLGRSPVLPEPIGVLGYAGALFVVAGAITVVSQARRPASLKS